MSDDSGTPAGWAWSDLDSVADIQLGKMLDREKRRKGTPLPYLRNVNVRWLGFDLSDLLTMPFEEHELERYGIRDGDVMVCEGGEPGRAAVWSSGDTTTKYQKALHRIRPTPGIEPKWIAYHLMRDAWHGDLSRRFTGTTIKHFTREAIREHRMRIAPAAEQCRIIAFLDSYFTRLDDAVASLERARANLKRYRASVLKAAVEGRLVPTEADVAHTESRDYEPASVLLERILVERRRRWQESELRKRRYEEPARPIVADLPSLPPGWCWATVDQVSSSIRNGYSKAPREEDGIPILRISSVRPMSVDVGDVRFLGPEEADECEPFRVQKGDLLFTRYNGNPSLVGVCGIVREAPERLIHPDKLIRARAITPLVFAEFVQIAANAGVSRAHLERRIRTTAGQSGISGADLKKMPVPLPPLAEQARIARETDRHWSVADKVEESMSVERNRVGRLRQSLLRWAFEGKLVDQDGSDEPAPVLLERIRRAREADDPTSKPRRGRKPKAA